MTVDEIVTRAVVEAAEILAARGQTGFFGEVGVKFQADKIVTIRIEETIRAT